VENRSLQSGRILTRHIKRKPCCGCALLRARAITLQEDEQGRWPRNLGSASSSSPQPVGNGDRLSGRVAEPDGSGFMSHSSDLASASSTCPPRGFRDSQGRARIHARLLHLRMPRKTLAQAGPGVSPPRPCGGGCPKTRPERLPVWRAPEQRCHCNYSCSSPAAGMEGKNVCRRLSIL
jgi:hypothetical protein